ncbi:hypothetical protein Tco_1499721, partial [Tanacetum coccineum]
GLGYGNERELNINESEVVHSVFNNRDSDVDDNPINDRFKTVEGFHAVPPPFTANFMPSRPDLSFAGLDETAFMSAVRKTTTSVPETEASTSKTSNDIAEKPKTVRSSAPLIEEWESDINIAKQSFPRAAVSNSTVRYVNTAASRPTVNGAKPSSNVFHKSHSSVKRTFYQTTAPKNSDFKEKVNIAKVNNVTTTRTKAVVSAVQGHEANAGNPQYTLHDQGVFDSGCSRHMTGNKSFLTDYQEIDGGFVAFRGSPKGGKITGKGKIRTDKLDFEDVYFVKELKFNLFSFLQMCDKKNSVLYNSCHS